MKLEINRYILTTKATKDTVKARNKAVKEQLERVTLEEMIDEIATYNTHHADLEQFHNTMECDWNDGEFDEKELRREYYQCELERLTDLTEAELVAEYNEMEVTLSQAISGIYEDSLDGVRDDRYDLLDAFDIALFTVNQLGVETGTSIEEFGNVANKIYDIQKLRVALLDAQELSDLGEELVDFIKSLLEKLEGNGYLNSYDRLVRFHLVNLQRCVDERLDQLKRLAQLLGFDTLDREQAIAQLIEHRLRGMDHKAHEWYFRNSEADSLAELSDGDLAALIAESQEA